MANDDSEVLYDAHMIQRLKTYNELKACSCKGNDVCVCVFLLTLLKWKI